MWHGKKGGGGGFECEEGGGKGRDTWPLKSERGLLS